MGSSQSSGAVPSSRKSATRKSAKLEALRALSEAAAAGPWFVRERPTKDGRAVIEDGRMTGIFPVTGEWHEIEFIVAAANYVRALLAEDGARP